MSYEFSVISTIYLVSGIIAQGVVFLLWNKRKTRGARFLLLSAFASAVWNFSNFFESSAITVDLKLLWSQISYLGITTCVAFFFLFTIEYAQLNRFINRKFVLLVLTVPFVTIVLAATNPLHNLIWKEIIINPKNNIGEYIYGWWFWLFVAYDYILLFTAITVLLSASFKYFIVHRIQFWLLILGSSLPFIANVLYIFKINPLTGLDITPISFTLTELVIAFSVFWLHLFAIMPIARKHIIDNLHDGVVILDNMNRIIETNPKFQIISNVTNNHLIGRPLDDIFLNITTVNGPTNEKEFLNETKILVNGEYQHYEIRYYPITDDNKKLIGKVLILHDITMRKSAMEIAMESNRRLKNELMEKESLIYDLNVYACSVSIDLKSIINSQLELTKRFTTIETENKSNELQVYFDKLNQQNISLINIINDLQLLTKIRKEEISLVPIDMLDIINSIKQVEFNENLSNISIVKSSEFPMVLGDRQLIEEVWRKLINYAIRLGGTPLRISIGFTQMRDSKTKFWIQDNGNGLPSDSIKKLFNPCGYDEKIISRENELDFSIIKKIIEKVGGQMNVTSKHIPGEGCIFSFVLSNSK